MTSLTSRIFAVHCWFLMIMPVLLTATTYIGFRLGVGPGSWIVPHPVAVIGFVQAYLLMAMVGLLSLRLGSRRPSAALHLTLIVAHGVPLFAMWTLWDVFESEKVTNIVGGSLFIHLPWIAVELICAWRDWAVKPAAVP